MSALSMVTSAKVVSWHAPTTSGRRATRHLIATARTHRAGRAGMRPLRAQAEGNGASKDKTSVSYKHLMVTLFDSNPYLAEGSRQALKTAAGLAAWNDSKVTVVVVDDEGSAAEEQTAMKLTAIKDMLTERGCSNFNVVEKVTTENHSALVGDVADDLEADLVVLSTDCVHEQNVDANLLAEFCPCSTLLIP